MGVASIEYNMLDVSKPGVPMLILQSLKTHLSRNKLAPLISILVVDDISSEGLPGLPLLPQSVLIRTS